MLTISEKFFLSSIGGRASWTSIRHVAWACRIASDPALVARPECVCIHSSLRACHADGSLGADYFVLRTLLVLVEAGSKATELYVREIARRITGLLIDILGPRTALNFHLNSNLNPWWWHNFELSGHHSKCTASNASTLDYQNEELMNARHRIDFRCAFFHALVNFNMRLT